MTGLMIFMFWSAYVIVMLSLLMWSASHPLMIGAIVLLSYMLGSLVVSLGVSFIVGIFLFLAGVSGMMVAFLYVVALCPNPVFSGKKEELAYFQVLLGWIFVLIVSPVCVMVLSEGFSFGVETGSMSEESQWLREPSMYSGLADLMPFLGALLFLCMVSVVSLCGQQKQCLGGQGSLGSSSGTVGVKRLYT